MPPLHDDLALAAREDHADDDVEHAAGRRGDRRQEDGRAEREEVSTDTPSVDPKQRDSVWHPSNMAIDMTDAPSRDEVSARLEASEARTDTKFAQLMGELKIGFAAIDGKVAVLGAKVDGVERSTAGLRATVILTGIAAVGVLVAILAYGQTWFGIGMGTRDVVRATVAETLQQQAEIHKR